MHLQGNVKASTRTGQLSLPAIEIDSMRAGLESGPDALVTHASPAIRLASNFFCAVGLSILAVASWNRGYWPVTLICWGVCGHFMHTFALCFHDAAHETLHPNHRVNEWLGCLYGTMILVPMTVYRRAHARHHAQLASINDPELYPFVDPGTSRSFRVMCAMTEILLGYFYTPLLFVRSVFVDGKLTDELRRQILLEYLFIALTATSFLALFAFTGTWHLYLIGVVGPAIFGGTYQTLRKYTEHLGLVGPTILQSTRSILPRDRWNQIVSSLVQHVDHHGTHHVRARIPYFELPIASDKVYRGKLEDLPVFHSYPAAFWDMLKSLGDPKAGPQWKAD